MWQTYFPRRGTRPVRVGPLTIGGGAPVSIQSMINTPTTDIDRSVDAICRLVDAGCELVRLAVPTLTDVAALEKIRNRLDQMGVKTALCADVHHAGRDIASACAPLVHKVRINPGLYVYHANLERPDVVTTFEQDRSLQEIEEQLVPLLYALRSNGCALRLGINHGSLSQRIFTLYGDTPKGMVESAMEYIRICEKHGFDQIVVSLKASRVPTMLAANRLAAQVMDDEGLRYPIHLGVTEAGNGDYGRIKSVAGIATLLMEGIGDTIRVSLTEDPVNEIPVCLDILQACGLRKTRVEYISCPSCGRTRFDIEGVLEKVKAATQHLQGMDIAVMGCIVNGPGEMADADYGYVGKGDGRIALYRNRSLVKNNIPEEQGVQELINLIKADGRWIDPD